MTQPAKKISMSEACDRAIDKLLTDVPKEDRGYVAYRLLKGMGGGLPRKSFVACPICGGRMPTEYHNGQRTCRNCCHYELETAAAEEQAKIEADSRRWMQIHHRQMVEAI